MFLVNTGMATPWTFPSTVTQYAQTGAEQAHISWLEIDNFSALKSLNQQHIKTTRDLVHIARDPRHDIVEKTYYLKLTNFVFQNLPSTLSGIQVRLTMKRFGRITDDEIFLCLNNDIVGDNFGDLDLSPTKIYGSETDTWNTSLTISDVQHSSFGVVLRFKSHPQWPHKSSALIDAIEIRVH